MTVPGVSENPRTEPRRNGELTSLPTGAVAQRVLFVAQRDADADVLLELPPPLQCSAVAVRSDATTADALHELRILTIPTNPGDAFLQEEGPLLAQARVWIESVSAGDPSPPQLMTLQGAQILWKPGRLAILAPPERLPAVRSALIEASYYAVELDAIERTLGAAWPQLEADMPLAFAFDEASLERRGTLRQRLLQVLGLRARLARIAPHVHCPHQHPPTLASQVGERFRERTRLIHRHEFLVEQIDVFDRVYEMCGQRANDFMLQRSGNTLEWVIIVLLLMQLLLAGFELLTSVGLP